MLELLSRPPAQPAPDALYFSTLARARDVALPIARAWVRQPRPAGWAREIHCGDVEGMALDEVRRRFPELWVRNDAQDDDRFAWPGGESYADFRTRILKGLRAAASAYAGQRIVIVTHAGVIAQVLGVIRSRAASVWSADRPDPLTATEII